MGIAGQRYAPTALSLGKTHVTHCAGSWLGPRAGLVDMYKIEFVHIGTQNLWNGVGWGGMPLTHGFHYTDFRDTHKCTTSRGYVLHRVSPKSVVKYGKHGQTLDTNLRTYVKHDSQWVDFHETHACLSFL